MFDDGDATSTAVGPFESNMVFQDGTEYPYTMLIELGVTRNGQGVADGQALAFTMNATITFFGYSNTSGVADFINMNTPIPVNPGGADCLRERHQRGTSHRNRREILRSSG